MLGEAARKSFGKENPIAYMNTILSNWHAKGIATPEAAATAAAAQTVVSAVSADELNALFADITEDNI